MCFSVSFFMSTLLYRTLRINFFSWKWFSHNNYTRLKHFDLFKYVCTDHNKAFRLSYYWGLSKPVQCLSDSMFLAFDHHALICPCSLVSRLICGYKDKSLALRLLCIKALFPPLWLTSLSTLLVFLESSEPFERADWNLGSFHHTFLVDVTLQRRWVVLVNCVFTSACFGIFIKGHPHACLCY